MPRWTEEDLKAYEARHTPSRPQFKHSLGDESLGEKKRKAKDTTGHAQRVTVSFVSFRTRLLDPDNLAGGVKYFLDGLRYAGLIPNDRPQDIILEVTQEKVPTRKEERTEIEIT